MLRCTSCLNASRPSSSSVSSPRASNIAAETLRVNPTNRAASPCSYIAHGRLVCLRISHSVAAGGAVAASWGGSGGGTTMGQQGIEIARLDHLGIVAGVCREIGVAAYLDARDEHTHERVSVGTATVGMLLNGLGFANRRLYLVSQFFKTKPVEHLLGLGITAEDLNDECLRRPLDWLY